jgi:hypothetical protein
MIQKGLVLFQGYIGYIIVGAIIPLAKLRGLENQKQKNVYNFLANIG